MALFCYGCANNGNNSMTIENNNNANMNKIMAQKNTHNYFYIEYDCFDMSCACEGEMCKISKFDDEDTEKTEENREFNLFAPDILQFLSQNYNDQNAQDATNDGDIEKGEKQDGDVNFNENNKRRQERKQIDLRALQEKLKIKEKDNNITTINDRIKITPKLTIITNTKSKITMNMSVVF